MSAPEKNSTAGLSGPVKIIAVLTGVFEVSFVAAAIKTTGAIQIAFTAAAIGGVFINMAAFWWTWITRPELFALSQFKSAADTVKVFNTIMGTKAKVDQAAEVIYAKEEEMLALASQTKIVYDEVTDLREQLKQQADVLLATHTLATIGGQNAGII